MKKRPDLDTLRASSEKPSWWVRTSHSLSGTIRSRTSIAALLAVTIGVVIAVGFWFDL